ncbi:universal stress protein [Kitasatospora sp. NPDC058965]|uniref:universal stress protein n=1 Tax=Kitasatospora sp. NPDC058965 TaxID=3346682 RepID=UPI0036CAC4F0
MDEGTSDAVRERRIVVGVSGSLGSIAALHRAVALARETDSEVQAVLAWEPVGGEYAYRRAPCPPLLESWRAAAVARLGTALDEAFGHAPAPVPLRGLAVRGDAAEVLLGHACRGDDLLVVGAGATSWLGRGLRHSVATHCARQARCPVLVVPAPELLGDLRAMRRRRLWHLPPAAPPAWVRSGRS